ncbi:MAG: hypothetical protein WBB25_01620 [Sulfitobacter sp.]
MGSISHLFCDLGTGYPPTGNLPLTPVEHDAMEEMQLASFDTGYQAGWEDALKAHEKNAEQATIDIFQNLQDISFTHHEAYLKLSGSMKPLLSQIVGKLLPQVAQKVVGVHILDQLTELMDSQAGTGLEIAVSPTNLDELQSMLSEMVQLPFTLVPDTSLSGGQAYLRIGGSEREINLDAVLSGISEALEAFFEQTKEDIVDG